MKKLIILGFLLLFPFTLSISRGEDHNFATTKEGIIDALTHPEAKQKPKTRTINGSAITKTRGIRIVTEKNSGIVGKTINISAKKSKQGFNLKIKFDFDSYAIRPESFALIDELGKALIDEKLKGQDIVIKGHTDSTGAETYNLRLSLNRALAVKMHLTENFPIPSFRLKVVGYGESLPLVSNSNEAKRQINRRVEIAAE